MTKETQGSEVKRETVNLGVLMWKVRHGVMLMKKERR